MNLIKHITLFFWTLIILGVVVFLIKQVAFGKRKINEEVNSSEAIYLGALIISAGIILQRLIGYVAISYDNIYKMQLQHPFYQFVKSGSSISVSGVILFGLSVFIAKFLSTIFFGSRNAVIEFGNNNKAYAIVRSALIISVSLLFLQLAENIIQYLIPTISIPLYH
ncbi:MAG: hypothetical protein ABIT81_01000 [Ferruginibacter sp.]